MFRERIVGWTKLLDPVTTIRTILTLTTAKVGTLVFTSTFQSRKRAYNIDIGPQRGQAIAYMQLSTLNR